MYNRYDRKMTEELKVPESPYGKSKNASEGNMLESLDPKNIKVEENNSKGSNKLSKPIDV